MRSRARKPGVGVLPRLALVRPTSRVSRDVTLARELAHLSDEAVVALVARSEEDALAELYDRYSTAAHSLARRVVRDQSLADDVVQDAFLAVWRSAARFVPERGTAATWLMTLVHRRAVDLIRHEQRRRADSLPDDLEETHADGDGSASDVVWLRLERERVQEALRRLPDKHRELLELAYYGGFTQTDLAERLGRPLGTIKSQMFAALTQLRELVEAGPREASWKKS